MTVSPVQNSFAETATTRSAGAATSGGKAGDFNAFLLLLITELKNQDPTKPLDPTQTVTQLASFSAVEQAVQTNALLSQLSDMSTLTQGSALIGRNIESADGSIRGVVESVTMTDSGAIATLTDGRRLALGSGITVS